MVDVLNLYRSFSPTLASFKNNCSFSTLFSNISLDFLLFVHGKPSIFLKFFFFGVVDIACIDTVGFNLTFASYDQV